MTVQPWNPVMNTPPEHQSLSLAVVERVAEAENVDPLDVRVPLYEVIDPDALDTLGSMADESRCSDVRVSFEYCGYTVTADGSGSVSLVDASASAPEPPSQTRH